MVERHVLRLGIGPGPQVHHDPLATVQAYQPVVAPAERLQLIREAGRDVGRTRAAPPAPLAEPAGDLAGLVRTEELVDPARTEAGRGRDLADGQPRLMGFDDGPDPLALGLFEAFRGEAGPGGDLLLAADLLFELVAGFHSSKLRIGLEAVQQTGRLMPVSCSDATWTPRPTVGHPDVRIGDDDVPLVQALEHLDASAVIQA